MKIGDKIWLYDKDRRVYVYDDGTKSNSPIYRKKFVEAYIVGETRVSWLVSRFPKFDESELKYATKIRKSVTSLSICATDEELDQRCWVHENGYRVSEVVRDLQDYKILKAVADLIGYNDKKIKN